MTLEVFLPWPPSVNSLTRAVRGRNILSARYRAWRDAAGKILSMQKPKAVTGPVTIEISLCPPNLQPYDPDNRIKACLDLLVMHRVIDGDDMRTVRRITVECSDGLRPGAQITVTPVEASA